MKEFMEKKPRARKRDWQTEKTKKKISAAIQANHALTILERVGECAMGETDMTQAQLKAASIYVNKHIPDRTFVETKQEQRSPEEIRAEMVIKFGEEKTRLLLGEEHTKPKLVVNNEA